MLSLIFEIKCDGLLLHFGCSRVIVQKFPLQQQTNIEYIYKGLSEDLSVIFTLLCFVLMQTLSAITGQIASESFLAPYSVCFSKLSLHIFGLIDRFHSRDQRPYWFNETKESICIKIEFNSQRVSLVHQYGRHSFVFVHQHGRRDVI